MKSLIKNKIIQIFPIIFNIRKFNKKRVFIDCKDTIMLHSIPNKANYLFYDTLEDWSKNIKNIKKVCGKINLTIDDGYKNIKPFLDFCIKEDIGITLFVVAEKIYPYLSFIQLFRYLPKGEYEFLGYKVDFKNNNKILREREAFLFNRYLLKNISFSEYKMLADNLIKEYNDLFQNIDEDLQLLTKEDIKYYAKFNNISIQSHGIYHFDMSKMTDEELEFELRSSKLEIEKLTGKKVEYFAYPYGLYNDRVVKFTKKIYKKAFIVGKDNNEFHINRIGCDNKIIKVKN